MNYLPGLALNLNSPDLCFLSSWDYRCEPPAPGSKMSFIFLNSSLPPASFPLPSFFPLLVVLGVELRSLGLHGRRPTTLTAPPALCTLFIFQVGSHTFCPGWTGPQFSYLCHAGMKVCITTLGFFVVVEMGSC
jgi:hypothetical protein